jgi:hypothetical protein
MNMTESYVHPQLYKQTIERAENAEIKLTKLETQHSKLQYKVADVISVLKAGTAGLRPEAAIASALETFAVDPNTLTHGSDERETKESYEFARTIERSLVEHKRTLKSVMKNLREMLVRWNTPNVRFHATHDSDVVTQAINDLDGVVNER